MNPVRILYLEDDELDRRAFFRMVRERALPYEVTAAASLAEVRARLAESRFDLIVADYHLPDGHATELFDEIKDIPFILLTGTLEEQLALRTLERGADDYLPKESQGQHLQALPFAIEKTLRRKRIHETEQRLTRELRQSEEQYRLLVEGMPNHAVMLLDTASRIVAWNPGAQRVFGWTKEDITGQKSDVLFTPEDRAADIPKKELRQARELGRGGADRWLVRKDGTRFYAAQSIACIRDENGEVRSYVKVASDATREKLAERVLRESEQWLPPQDSPDLSDSGLLAKVGLFVPAGLRSPLSRYGVAIAITVIALVVLALLMPLFGQTTPPTVLFVLAITVSAWWGGFGPGLASTGIAALAVWWAYTPPHSSIAVPSASESVRLLLTIFSGGTISLLAGATHRAAAQQGIATARLAAEVQERRKTEAAVREQAQMLDLSYDAVLAWPLDGTIRYWNSGAERLYGRTRTEVLGRVPHELLQTQIDGGPATFLMALKQDKQWSGELRHRTRDGREVVVESRMVLMPGEDANGTAVVIESNRDITARREAEEQLRQVAQFPEENPNPVLRVSNGGILLYANRVASEVLAAMGWHADHPVPAPFKAVVERALRAGGTTEHEIECAEGRILSFTVTPIEDTGYVNLYGRDVTDRKRAEEKVWRNELRFRSFVEATTQIVWTTNPRGEVDMAIPSWQAYTGQTEEQARGFGWMDAIREEDRPRVAEAWQKAFDTRGLYEVEYLARTHDGSWRNVLARGVPVRNADGTVREYIGACIDITERKRAEDTLRESELFYRQTLESIPGMVFTTRPDGYCDYQSQQWVDYTGVPMSEHLGDGWNRLLHPDDRPRAYAAWRAAVEGRSPYDLEYRVRRHDGQYEWFKVIGRPIRDTAGQIIRWFGTAINIEDLKRAEAERDRQYQLFRRLVEISKEVVGEKSLPGLLQKVADAARELTGGRVASSGHGYVSGRFAVGAASRDEGFPPCPPGQDFAVEKGGVYMQLIDEVDSLRLTDAEMRSHSAWWGLPQDHVPMRGLLGVKLVDAQGKPNGTIMVSDKRDGEFTEQDEAILKQLGAITSLALQHVEAREQAEKRAEEVALSEERLRMAQQVARVGTFEWNVQSGVNTWSAELEKIYGLPPGGFAGTQEAWEQLVHPEDRGEVVRRIEQAMEQGAFEAEWRVIWPDGTLRWLFGRAWVFKNECGEPLKLIGVNIDITERKQAEEVIRESEERFRTLADATPVLIWQCGTDRSCDYFNRSWLEFTGRTLEEESGSGWAEGVHPEDRERALQLFASAAHRQEPFEMEYRLRHHTGEYRWILDRGVPRRTSDGWLLGYIGGCIDISDRKRAEEELQAAKDSAERAKAAAEQANRTKDHFLAVLSHELRTPLTPVVMSLSMLQDRPDLDAGVRESLEMIRRNVEMEARLIDDLLDVSRIARGKIELNRSPIELCTILHRAVEVCRPDIEARRLHFGVDIGPSAPYWINADASRLQQVFWNLLKNAIKFTPHEGCVGIRCRPDHDHVTVEVNDSGIGIEAEALSRVFNAFEQAERSITRRFGGLGLGLAITKALVELHGGQITAHSEGRDKGATFRVRLPLTAPAGQPAPPPAPAVRGPRVIGPLRVLLVEDHGVTAKMMKMVLTAEGHTVETAGDVATALELADQHPFDLLLSDLGLPDGSGHDLIRQLRDRGHRFPGIALSGYGQEEDIQRSREAGFAAHLTKPASREAVVEAIAATAPEEPATTSTPAGNEHVCIEGFRRGQ